MPEAIKKLTNQSSDAQVKAAISSCMAYTMKEEGMTQEQAAGKCYGMAREKTGKALEKKE
mgnify:CR=1 FL=1